MAYTGGFYDNATYGTDDVNGIIKKMSTQGISVEFEDILNDGVSYTPSDLNGLFEAIVSDGVTKDSCKVVMSGGNAKVMAGTIIFSNGSFLTVDNEGVTLPVTAGVKNYVYAYADMSLNNSYIKCETAAPTGDYVMLAEVENGTVTDKRKFAVSKFVAGYNMHESFNIDETYNASVGGEWTLLETFAVKKSDYQKLLFTNHTANTNFALEYGEALSVIWDLTTQTCPYGGFGNAKSIYTDRIKVKNGSMDAFVKFVRNGLNIEMYGLATSSGNYSVDITIELC